MFFITMALQQTLSTTPFGPQNPFPYLPTNATRGPVNPWNQEIKISSTITQSLMVHGGYSVNAQAYNSKNSLGFVIKTDPYEPTNKIAFSRFYYRYKHNKITAVIGSYRLQLGEGIVKTKGNASFRSNTQWAGKSEDWALTENRGFNRNFPIHGAAIKIPLRKSSQIMASYGFTKLCGKITDGTVTSWYRNGLLTDSLRIANKNNFSCKSASLAYRYHSQQTNIGISSSIFKFSQALSIFHQPTEAEVNWTKYPANDIQSENTNARITSMVYPEFWISSTLNNGNLTFLHVSQQFSNPFSTKSSTGLLKFKDFISLKNESAVIAGMVVPMDKNQDVSVRFQSFGNRFVGIENEEISRWQGMSELRCTWQNQIHPAVYGSVTFIVSRPSNFNKLNPSSWDPQLQSRWTIKKQNIIVSATTKFMQVNRSNTDDFENSNFNEWDNYIHSTPELYFYPNPQTWRFHSHVELKNNFSMSNWGEMHLYFQSENGKTSSCTEWIYQQKNNHGFTIQSGLACFQTQQTLMVQGLQVSPIQQYVGINNNGMLLFIGIKNKTAEELTQWFHLQIMQNFGENRQLSARIFALVWFR